MIKIKLIIIIIYGLADNDLDRHNAEQQRCDGNTFRWFGAKPLCGGRGHGVTIIIIFNQNHHPAVQDKKHEATGAAPGPLEGGICGDSRHLLLPWHRLEPYPQLIFG